MRSLLFLIGCVLLGGSVLSNGPVGCSSNKDAPSDDDAPPDEDAYTPDLCEPPSGEVCSTFPQCGCAANENCNIVTASGSTACVPVGPGALHATCGGAGECEKGLQCFGGVCVPLCLDEDEDCTIAGSPRCTPVTVAMEGNPLPVEIPGLAVCLAQCDPLSPAAVCGEQRGCAFFSALGEDNTTHCVAAGTATGAGGCASDPFACAPGYGCFDQNCEKLCRVEGGDECGAGTCTAFAEPRAHKGVQLGACK